MTSPLTSLHRAGTVRRRAAAVAQAVADGRSAVYRFHPAAFVALAARLAARRDAPLEAPLDTPPNAALAGSASAPGASSTSAARADLWALLGPAGQTWWRSTVQWPREERLRAASDLLCVLSLIDTQAAVSWTYRDLASMGPATVEAASGAQTMPTADPRRTEDNTPAIDALALPAERQSTAELFALFDRFTDAGGSPAEDATTQASPLLASEPDVAAASSSASSPGPEVLRGRAAVARAVLRAFTAGVFSSVRSHPMQVDARALSQIDPVALKAALACTPGQALPGLEVRAQGLAAWGQHLQSRAASREASPMDSQVGSREDPQTDSKKAPAGPARAGDWLAPWLHTPAPDALALADAAAAALAPAWPCSPRVLGLPAGDVWPHAWAGDDAVDDQGLPSRDLGSGAHLPLLRPAHALVRALAPLWHSAWADDQPRRPDALHTIDTPLDSPPPGLQHGYRLLDRTEGMDLAWLLHTGVIAWRHAADAHRLLPLSSAAMVEGRAVLIDTLARLAQHLVDRPGGSEAAAWAAIDLDMQDFAAGQAAQPADQWTPLVPPDTGLW